MAKHSPSTVAPQLQEIITLARRQVDLENLIEELEQALSAQKEDLRALTEEDLPNAMAEANLTEFTLDTGEKIQIKHDFDVGIPAERKPEALDWLDAKGYGGLIKTVVAVPFGKGDLSRAQELALKLLKAKYEGVVLNRDVHWQTLKAWVVESARATPPRPVPSDLFGTRAVNKSIVKLPKQK